MAARKRAAAILRLLVLAVQAEVRTAFGKVHSPPRRLPRLCFSSVPPSRAAAAAATAGLQRALGTLAESSSAGSLERIVRDSDGIMAAAAAERAAWEATALPEPEAWQLPDDMHATLREHTRVQVEEFLERTF